MLKWDGKLATNASARNLTVSFSFFVRFNIFDDLNLHGLLRRIHWRNFQHRYKSRPFILCAIQMPPKAAASAEVKRRRILDGP